MMIDLFFLVVVVSFKYVYIFFLTMIYVFFSSSSSKSTSGRHFQFGVSFFVLFFAHTLKIYLVQIKKEEEETARV